MQVNDNSPRTMAEIEAHARALRAQALRNGVKALRLWISARLSQKGAARTA